MPVTSLVSAWSAATGTIGSVRLHASETDNYGWKKFYSLESSQDPYLTFTYNRAPNAASAPTLQAPPATSYTPPGSTTPMLFTTDSTPQFSSKATDPDGNTVSMTVEVHTSTTTSASTLKASCATAYVASAATGLCSPTTALADSTRYFARTSVKDELGLLNGTWSPWTDFYTSWSTPPAAVISCPAPYSNGSWQDQGPATDITCTVTAAGVPGNYATPGYIDLTVDGVVKPRVKITPSNDPNVAKTTVAVAMASAGGHTISAVAVARTLKVSPAATYSFGWGQAGLSQPGPAPAARVTTTGAINIAAAGPPRGVSAVPTAKVRWRIAGSSDDELVGWNDATSAPLTVVDNAAAGISVTGSWNTKVETADAFLDSDPATAGVQPTALNDRVPVLLDVQVCLTYSTSGTQCTWSATKVSVLRVPHAFGSGFPTAAAGPGQVALFTGEFNTSATDVTVPGYTGALSISRSHSTFGNSTAAAADPVSSVFGPGWTAQLDGSDAGNAGLQVADGTGVDGTIAFIDADGSALVYATPTGARRSVSALTIGAYPGVDEATKTSGTTLAVSLLAGVTTLTLTDEDGTTTAFNAVAEPATKTAAVKFAPATVTEPGSVGATTYTRDATGRVTRILAPVPPGVTCPATGTLNPGCRALRVIYATTTTATSTTPGDITGQVSGIWLDIYDPAKTGGPGMTSIQVADYKYDASKRLVQVADPRSTVAPITYGYDAGNHLTQVASAGATPIALTYTGTDPKLSTVTRARPAGDPAGGTATLAAFVYGVPTSGAGLPDLSGTAVATWAQAKAPTYAAAVFGPDYTGSLTTPDYTFADLSYTDEAGYTTNTANYGAGAWQRSSADYDGHGNVVATLDPVALAQVVAGGNPGAAAQVASTTVYNPTDILGAGGVVLVPAGTQVSDTYGPARQVTLAGTTDGTTVLARPRMHTDYDQGAPNAGVNPATGVAYRLPTTVTVSAADPGTGTDLSVVSKTLTGYDPIDGKPASDPTSGWTLGAATSSTTDMDLSGTFTTGDITTRTRFDDQGRAVESRQPSSGAGTATPTDAGTSLSNFYTAAVQAAPNAACGGKPQWAGLTCRTYPAGDPSGGAGGATTLPDITTTAFSYLLAPLTVVETSGAVTRTTTSTYLADGRTDTTRSTVAGLASSIPAAGTKAVYDATTGQALRQMKLDPATGDVTTTGTTSVFDTWGRATSFTSDSGDQATTTSYDAAGRVSTVTDAKGAVAYTYDGTDAAGKSEPRGKTTKVVVTRTGTNTTTSPLLTYTGAYDEAGALTLQKLPGGIAQTTTYDVAGQPVGLAYAGQVTPVDDAGNPGTPVTGDWLAWSQTNDINGRVAREWTPAGAAFAGGPGVNALGEVQPYDTGDATGSDRSYSYDRADRLVKVADRTAATTGTVFDPSDPTAGAGTSCAVRTYDYAGTVGSNGNRTSQGSNTFGPDCVSAPGTATAKTYAYDSADRPTTGNGGSGQYVYDALGRQTTMPAADAPTPGDGTAAHDITTAYYDSDLPQAITQDGTTTSYTLNTGGRRQTSTTGPTGGAPTSTTVRHYTDTSDNPAWIDKDGAITRSTENLAGDLGATIAADGTATLPLSNLHGDTLTTIIIPATQAETTAASAIGAWSDYTEFGTPRDTAATTAVGGPGGYGWLGAKQRSTTAESAGLTLMGDRLYNSVTGRFTSVDPEPGGGATAYGYPTDPINQFDLNGHCWSWAQKACNAAKAVGNWAYRNRSSIIHHAVLFAAGAGAVALAGIVCAGTAGVGCVIMAGALFGAGLNVTGQTATSMMFRERIRTRDYYRWMAQGAFAGATGGYAKTLPKRRFWLPAKMKIAAHHRHHVVQFSSRMASRMRDRFND